MSRYGLKKDFVNSGDFRIYLATADQKSEKRALFEKVRHMDHLISEEKSKERSVLDYDQESINRGDQFRKDVDSYRPLGFPMLHRKGICMLLGNGPSLNPSFARKAHDMGIPIICIGNSIAHVPFADYWIGSRDVFHYHPLSFERQNTISFVSEKTFEDSLWDFKNNRPLISSPKSLGGCVPFKAASSSSEVFFNKPSELSFFRIPSSFTVSLSICASLGFSDIIFSGIDMSTDLSNFYYKGDIPHKEDLNRKTNTYASLKSIFPDIFNSFSRSCIRLCSLGTSPFEMPCYSESFLSEVFMHKMISSRTISLSDVFRSSSISLKEKIVHDEANRAAIIRPIDLLGLVPKMQEEASELFGEDLVNRVARELTEAEKTGGCTSCKKNSIIRPIYTKFESLALNKKEELEGFWKKYLPHKYIVQVRTITGDDHGKYIFRSDKGK